MNSISFTPQQNINYTANCRQTNISQPAFKGLPKGNQAKDVVTIGTKMAKSLIPFSEKLKALASGELWLEKSTKNNRIITATKRDLLTFKPKTVIRDAKPIRVKRIINYNKDGSSTIEYIDYLKQNEPSTLQFIGKDGGYNKFSGLVKISKDGKTIEINDAQRDSLIKSMTESIYQDYPEVMDLDKLRQYDTEEKLDAFMTKFYTDPNVIAKAMLSAPTTFADQLNTYPRSIGKGVQHLIEKLS